MLELFVSLLIRFLMGIYLICTSSSAVASVFSFIMKKYVAKPPKARSLRKRVYRATLGDYATVERRATDSLNFYKALKTICFVVTK